MTAPRSPSQRRTPRLADLVAGDLRRRILSGVIDDGAILPKQEDLLAEFEVSLPTLREALRILESEGLVRVQRGKHGGSVVHRPTTATAAYAVATVLESNRVALPDVAMALQEIEPVCVELAATRDDRDELVVPRLRALNERSARAIDDEDEYRQLVYELHKQFVAASGSQTLALMASALEALWIAHARELAARQPAYPGSSRAVRAGHVKAHTEIIEAIARGDGPAARSLAREHMREATSYSLSAAEGVPVDSSSISPGSDDPRSRRR